MLGRHKQARGVTKVDTESHLKSISAELAAIRDRVRNIIGSAHWLSDGEWKERVLRQVLSRYIPESTVLSTGFVIGNKGLSTQVDVLFRDSGRPTLFKDDTFCIVTPEAVSGIIEVKTNVAVGRIRDVLEKLANNIEIIRADGKRIQHEGKIFSALMSYGLEAASDKGALDIAALLPEICRNKNRNIDILALGPDYLVKYFGYDPTDPKIVEYNSWRVYKLSGMAHGYFISSMVEYTAMYSVIGNNMVWYPESGKESGFIGEVKSPHRGRVF